MKNLMTIKELEKLGFEGDAENMSCEYYGSDVLDYYESDVDALDDIRQYENPVMELVVTIENGVVIGFSQAYGPSSCEIGVYEEDNLEGVIDWLRK